MGPQHEAAGPGEPPGPAAARRSRWRARGAALAIGALGTLAWLSWPGPDGTADERSPAGIMTAAPSLPPGAGSGTNAPAGDREPSPAVADMKPPAWTRWMSARIERASFGSAWDRFEALRIEGAATAELSRLARQLDEGLSAQLASGGIDPGDALLLKADLLDVLEPGPARRGQLLAQWHRQHLAHEAPGAAHAPQTAQILAAWQAQASEDRDPGELQEQLEALRLGARAPKALSGQ